MNNNPFSFRTMNKGDTITVTEIATNQPLTLVVTHNTASHGMTVMFTACGREITYNVWLTDYDFKNATYTKGQR